MRKCETARIPSVSSKCLQICAISSKKNLRCEYVNWRWCTPKCDKLESNKILYCHYECSFFLHDTLDQNQTSLKSIFAVKHGASWIWRHAESTVQSGGFLIPQINRNGKVYDWNGSNSYNSYYSYNSYMWLHTLRISSMHGPSCGQKGPSGDFTLSPLLLL